jgi:hypothetical protein
MPEVHTSETAQGQDKVARYGWSVKDRPGRMMMIQKTRLKIDHMYQRDALNAKVVSISKAWSWVACGAIVVAHRDGEFFVVDGQYRTLAALKRSDIDQLPCIVFETDDIRQEAQGFLNLNTLRKPITSRDRYRALLVVGDETAKFVESLLAKAGRAASDHEASGSARCLTTLMKWTQRNLGALERAWPAITAACEGGALQARIVDGLCYIESRLVDGASLSQSQWHKRVVKVGAVALCEGADKAAAFYEKGGEKVWASGMLERINKGLQNKLALKAETAEQ